MGHKVYGERWCYVCGTWRSTSGWHFHARKHVREGKMKETMQDGRYVFSEIPGIKLIAPPRRVMV